MPVSGSSTVGRRSTYRIWYEKNRYRLIKKSKMWAENNPQKRKAVLDRYYEINMDEIKKRAKRWRNRYRKDEPRKYLLSTARRRAKQRNMEFTITLEDLPEIPMFCPLLGIEIDSWSEGPSHHPSIDRINNARGYIPGNVQFISQRANMLKNNATVDELLCLVCNWLEMEEED